MKTVLLVALALALAPITCFAKGPVGIGKLEIGVSRSTVEALTPSDGVYLNSPLTPYEYKHSSPVPGEDNFNTTYIRRQEVLLRRDGHDGGTTQLPPD